MANAAGMQAFLAVIRSRLAPAMIVRHSVRKSMANVAR